VVLGFSHFKRLALMPGRQIPGRVAIFLDEKVPRRRTAQKINRTAEAARIITSSRNGHPRRSDGPPVFWRAPIFAMQFEGLAMK